MDFSFFRKNIKFDPLFQLSVAGLFFFAYAFLFSWVLPEGINHRFLTESIIVFWPLLWVMAFFILGCLFFGKMDMKGSGERKIHSEDLYLLLLPLGPLVQYMIFNLNILNFFNSLMLLIIFISCAFFLSFLIPLLLPSIEYQKTVMILGISFSFVLFDMASLANRFHWHRMGDVWVQIMVFLFIFVILFILSRFNRKLLMVTVLAFFVSGIIFSVWNASLGMEDRNLRQENGSLLYELIKNRQMKRTPDIFLLTYDAYVENETMLQYGIDNREQEEYLSARGFHLYKGVYSIGSDTLSTMDTMLDVNQIVKPPRRGVSGNGAVQNILKDRGYATFGVIKSDYVFMGTRPSYDRFFPEKQKASFGLLVEAILEGEFRFDVGFEDVVFSDFVEQKRKIMSDREDSPKFLYTHTGPGHSQNSGKCLPNEVELFAERLKTANREMKEDIEAIIKNNPDAIIIVNGDHGPYLTRNCTSLTGYNKEEIRRLDIQDRYGAFLAIRWPEGAELEHEKIRILQDVFPVVFSYLFDDMSIQGAGIPDITMDTNRIGGVSVENGMIHGGVDDGDPLFVGWE